MDMATDAADRADELAARIEAMKKTVEIVRTPTWDRWELNVVSPTAADLFEALEPLLWPERCSHPDVTGDRCEVCKTVVTS